MINLLRRWFPCGRPAWQSSVRARSKGIDTRWWAALARWKQREATSRPGCPGSCPARSPVPAPPPTAATPRRRRGPRPTVWSSAPPGHCGRQREDERRVEDAVQQRSRRRELLDPTLDVRETGEGQLVGHRVGLGHQPLRVLRRRRPADTSPARARPSRARRGSPPGHEPQDLLGGGAEPLESSTSTSSGCRSPAAVRTPSAAAQTANALAAVPVRSARGRPPASSAAPLATEERGRAAGAAGPPPRRRAEVPNPPSRRPVGRACWGDG